MSPRRLWLILHEPRVVTAATGVAWVLIAGIGLAAILSPPPTLSREWGTVITATWGSLLITGGAVGLAGCLPGWWWVERIGITLASTGAAMYLSVVLILHAWGPDSRLVTAGFVLLSLVGLAIRWHRIRGLALDPTRGRNDRS